MEKLTAIAIALVIIITIRGQTQQLTTAFLNKLDKNITETDMKNSQPTGELLFLYYFKLTAKYENPEAWNEKTEEIIAKHGVFLDQLGKEGKLIMAGRTKYPPGHEYLFGIVVIKASSLEEATQWMKDDPVIIEGVMYSTIHPYSIGIRYFENLSQ